LSNVYFKGKIIIPSVKYDVYCDPGTKIRKDSAANEFRKKRMNNVKCSINNEQIKKQRCENG
jgi:hypothetical protein